jgi:hypothetical protein
MHLPYIELFRMSAWMLMDWAFLLGHTSFEHFPTAVASLSIGLVRPGIMIDVEVFFVDL